MLLQLLHELDAAGDTPNLLAVSAGLDCRQSPLIRDRLQVTVRLGAPRINQGHHQLVEWVATRPRLGLDGMHDGFLITKPVILLCLSNEIVNITHVGLVSCSIGFGWLPCSPRIIRWNLAMLKSPYASSILRSPSLSFRFLHL